MAGFNVVTNGSFVLAPLLDGKGAPLAASEGGIAAPDGLLPKEVRAGADRRLLVMPVTVGPTKSGPVRVGGAGGARLRRAWRARKPRLDRVSPHQLGWNFCLRAPA